ncbi:unnamed protein product [Chrysoparadoxa australica]
MESIITKVNWATHIISGSETEKKIGGFLFDDDIQWSNSKELHGLAALTFNEEQCFVVMALIHKALDPKDNTWPTLLKAVKLTQHFVIYGAERCVDHAWDMMRELKALCIYNSSLHSRTGSLMGSGTDYGVHVREAARSFTDLLNDKNRIRKARADAREEGSLLPQGTSDDYSKPVRTQAAGPLDNDAFGVVQESALGAKFDLNQVPGMYEGRPDRYFDKEDDPRRRRQEVEDASRTRNFLAGDLLGISNAALAAPEAKLPEAQNLVELQRQKELERKLKAQQEQLQQLKSLVAGAGAGAGAGGGAGMGGSMTHGAGMSGSMTQGAGMSGGMHGAGIGGSMQGGIGGSMMQGAGMSGNMQGAGMSGNMPGAGMGGSMQGAGMGGSMQGAGMGGSMQSTMQGAGMGGRMQGDGMGGSIQQTLITGSMQGAGMSGSMHGAGMGGSTQGAGMGGSMQNTMQGTGMGGDMQGAGMGGSMQGAGMGGSMQGAGMGGTLHGGMGGRMQGAGMVGSMQGGMGRGMMQGAGMGGSSHSLNTSLGSGINGGMQGQMMGMAGMGGGLQVGMQQVGGPIQPQQNNVMSPNPANHGTDNQQHQQNMRGIPMMNQQLMGQQMGQMQGQQQQMNQQHQWQGQGSMGLQGGGARMR